MLNLDTHMVVHLLSGSLKKHERDLIVKEALGISGIVLWELAKLVQLNRIEMDLDGDDFARFVRSTQVFPISPAIARKSIGLDFRGDPADEIIAATSIVERIPLLTRDREILKSKLVPWPNWK